jgi:hypothetical protein
MKNQQIETINNNIKGQAQRRKRAGERLRQIPLVDMNYLETHDPKDIAAEFHSRALVAAQHAGKCFTSDDRAVPHYVYKRSVQK